jgi:hypothetical protein
MMKALVSKYEIHHLSMFFLHEHDRKLLQTMTCIRFGAILFQVALVLSLEIFVTIKAEVAVKEKRQRNEQVEAIVGHLSMCPFLRSLGKPASG